MLIDVAQRIVPGEIRSVLSRALGRDKIPRPRRYIPHGVGVEEFFDRLREAGVSYAILRWFETLPQLEPGEDIDILVADADLSVLAGFLDQQSGSVPCDIYTVSGLPGTQYKGQAYFPRPLAEAILANRRLQAGRFSVPAPIDHFDSLAYHALYQKGPASGLPMADAAVMDGHVPEHDYTGILARLARELHLTLRMEADALDRYLNDKHYRPKGPMLTALMSTNAWLRQSHGKGEA